MGVGEFVDVGAADGFEVPELVGDRRRPLGSNAVDVLKSVDDDGRPGVEREFRAALELTQGYLSGFVVLLELLYRRRAGTGEALPEVLEAVGGAVPEACEGIEDAKDEKETDVGGRGSVVEEGRQGLHARSTP